MKMLRMAKNAHTRLLFQTWAHDLQLLASRSMGVQTDARGRVVVDARYRTTADGIYAAGDVIGPPALRRFRWNRVVWRPAMPSVSR